MSSKKIPTDIIELIPSEVDSSDNDSVLEKQPKKEKKPYVMTEKRRLNCEKMRLARSVNVDKRRVVAPLYLYIRTRTCACGSRPGSKFRVM
jgi:hypothetical protein